MAAVDQAVTEAFAAIFARQPVVHTPQLTP
jgi:hypothetical protein